MGHGAAGEVIRDLHFHTLGQPRTSAWDYVRHKVGRLDSIRDVLEETQEWYRRVEKEGRRSIKRHRRDPGIRWGVGFGVSQTPIGTGSSEYLVMAPVGKPDASDQKETANPG